MSDTPDTDRQTGPDEVPVEKSRKTLWEMISLIWVIPVLALAVALGAAYRSYADRGPLIEISFDNAAGVAADETELRYRDIAVGLVEEVGFSEDLSEVVVGVRLEKHLAPFVDTQSRFWVVRPQVTAQGVSGLDTVLSGVYIQGDWDGVPGEEQSAFVGLNEAPLLGVEEGGIEFTIRSDTGLPTGNTPILFKGVEVGRIDTPRVTEDGLGVVADAVIYEEHTGLVTTSTRFWDISGFNFTLGASGARLNFSSLASLISGGATFETMGSGGAPLVAGAEYELFGDEDAARDDFLVEGEGSVVDMTMIFAENLSGLSSGAPVELGGLRIGDVASISGIVDRDRFGDGEVRLIASVRINPNRIGLTDGMEEDGLIAFLEDRVGEGLRARLTNASLLTGGLKIELVELDNAAPAALDLSADPYPVFPTVASDVTDVTATAQGVLQRVNDLPIEEVLNSAVSFLDGASQLVGSEDMQQAPAELRDALAAVRSVAQSDGVQQLPAQVSAVVADLQSTTEQINALLAEIEAQDAIGKLTAAIESVSATADSLPPLVSEASALLQDVRDLPLEEVVAQASDLLDAAEQLITQETVRQVPEQLNAALDELRQTLGSARGLVESEGVQALPAQVSALTTDLQAASGRINGLLADIEAQDAVGQITAAIESVTTAADSLPPLVSEASAVLTRVQELPLEEVVAQASGLLDAAEQLIDQETTRQVPEQLNAALAELRETLGSARGIVESEGVQALPAQVSALTTDLQGASTRINRLLSDFEEQDAIGKLTAAIESFGTTVDGLPSLVEQARGILGQAEDLPLESLVEQATGLLDSAEQLVNQDSTREVPEQLNAALDELRQTLAELRDGGLVENANATLASARNAADAIAEATETLPALSAQLRQVATQAGSTLSTYDRDSEFSRDVRMAIRQVQAAADSIDRLARTLERNPNSLILGR
ncbi:MlaD family protein [Roseisalinus antarcticus]|uniref:Paraquat-inducible protein B n=1 Tax=Roseisalinus antarcticus TaxID=254357 RepID=A0A1Y5TU65_9RHOB|nr:MlaD family protein [Roseisalinus antarcticus]SLN68169.1 Paraquat-inducible protein B [Roseisalinus antarcticus]